VDLGLCIVALGRPLSFRARDAGLGLGWLCACLTRSRTCGGVDGGAGNEASLSSNEAVLEHVETDVVEDAAEREYEVVVVVDEVGDGGVPPKIVVVGNGIQFVATLPTAPPFLFPFPLFIAFPRNDVPSPAGLAETGNRNARCARSSWMGDCSSDLSGRLGAGGAGMVKDDKDGAEICPCAKDATSTCAWARETVHVGRDLWYDVGDDDVEYDDGVC